MKRIGNLFEKVISIENLELADKKARKGKTNSREVKSHDINKDINILMLNENLKNKTFTTSSYKKFTIFDKKERVISSLPYYPDRIFF